LVASATTFLPALFVIECMKTLLLLAFSFIGCYHSQAQNNPVVVELFTSQGCSSCPSADKNLTEILQRAKKDGNQVYGLSFHVDYWNYIGWKDPYSNKEFTDRQRKYAAEMNLRSIYTPQMVINGREELVGSNKAESAKIIAKSLTQKPFYQVIIKDLQLTGDVLNLKYSLDKDPINEVIHIAVVEKDTENYVPSGENNGKKLHHVNVVRVFVTNPIKRSEEIKLQIPKMNLSNALVIVYVQSKAWSIVGATSQSLN
jgi:hypothetical protein